MPRYQTTASPEVNVTPPPPGPLPRQAFNGNSQQWTHYLAYAGIGLAAILAILLAIAVGVILHRYIVWKSQTGPDIRRRRPREPERCVVSHKLPTRAAAIVINPAEGGAILAVREASYRSPRRRPSSEASQESEMSQSAAHQQQVLTQHSNGQEVPRAQINYMGQEPNMGTGGESAAALSAGHHLEVVTSHAHGQEGPRGQVNHMGQEWSMDTGEDSTAALSAGHRMEVETSHGQEVPMGQVNQWDRATDV